MKKEIQEFWEEKWVKNHIPFHQSHVQPFLIRFCKEAFPPPGQKVFVPLCGKTLDMKWLMDEGYEVLGLELSEIAVRDFFKEQKISYEKREKDGIVIYKGKNITLYVCDLFSIPESEKPHFSCDFLYDRASLIALHKEDRQKYYPLMKNFLRPHGSILLSTFQSLENPPKTPPYPVDLKELKDGFGSSFSIKLLEQNPEKKSHVYLIRHE